MVHAACNWSEQPRPEPMVEALILLVFLISGASAGWMGVHLLPQDLFNDTTNVEGVRWVLTGFGAFIGLIAGLVFRRLRQQLMR
ncbi:MAG: PIN/TRAM domain-containing protein, partial [Synechococcaceae bacterium WB9_4xC_028]|nr:PIN/TRAM domain-containing protein [Synechococcaceae bacterium WB9_4xC_028]